LQARHQTLHLVAAETGADATDVNEVPTAMDADEQRAQAAAFVRPAADDDLMAGTAFRFRPIAAAARAVLGVEALGDDALEVHATRGLQHGIARRLEMFDVANERQLAL